MKKNPLTKNSTDLDLKVFDFLKKVPKSEIHLHIEACVSPELFFQMTNKNHLNLQKEEFLQKYNFKNLNQFIELFLFLQSLFQKEEDLKYMMLGLKDYMLRQRIIYAEVFFSPTRFMQKGFNFQKMIEILTNEIRELKKKYYLDVKLIIDISRTFGVENAISNLKEIVRYRESEIIGIGMGGAEKNNPSKNYQRVFEEARNSGFKTVVHSGEDLGPEEIWDALKYLKPHRIGHAVSASLDEELMYYLADKQIPIEICLSSNVMITDLVKEYKDHPLKQFYEKNMLVCLNTDDPEIFQTDLALEYFNAYQHLNFNLEDLIQLVKNGFLATFNSDKSFLLESVTYEIKNLKKAINI